MIETTMSNILLQPLNIMARVLHCSEIIIIIIKNKIKRHNQTHFEVKIVHMYNFVSRKNTNRKRKSLFLYSVIFKEWDLHVGRGREGERVNACMYCIM